MVFGKHEIYKMPNTLTISDHDYSKDTLCKIYSACDPKEHKNYVSVDNINPININKALSSTNCNVGLALGSSSGTSLCKDSKYHKVFTGATSTVGCASIPLGGGPVGVSAAERACCRYNQQSLICPKFSTSTGKNFSGVYKINEQNCSKLKVSCSYPENAVRNKKDLEILNNLKKNKKISDDDYNRLMSNYCKIEDNFFTDDCKKWFSTVDSTLQDSIAEKICPKYTEGNKGIYCGCYNAKLNPNWLDENGDIKAQYAILGGIYPGCLDPNCAAITKSLQPQNKECKINATICTNENVRVKTAKDIPGAKIFIQNQCQTIDQSGGGVDNNDSSTDDSSTDDSSTDDSSTDDSSTDDSSVSKLNLPLIIGISVGVFLFIVLLIIVITKSRGSSRPRYY
jgi:hypothetical protein